MLLGAKVLVFALFCTAGTINPFITLILQDLHYTAAETGTLISLSKTVALLLTPVLCAVADAYRCHEPLLVVVSLLAAAVMVLWWGAVPPHQQHPHNPSIHHIHHSSIVNGRNETRLLLNPNRILSENRRTAMDGGLTTVSASALRASTAAVLSSDSSDFSAAVVIDTATVLTALLLGLYYTISGSKSVITDALVMKQIDDAMAHRDPPRPDANSTTALLRQRREPVEAVAVGEVSAQETKDIASTAAYPLQRLWGSISYGCTASLTGLLVKLLSSLSGGGSGGGGSGSDRPTTGPAGPDHHHHQKTTMNISRVQSGSGRPRGPYLSIPLLHALSLLFFAGVVTAVTRRGRPPAGGGGGGKAHGRDDAGQPSNSGGSPPLKSLPAFAANDDAADWEAGPAAAPTGGKGSAAASAHLTRLRQTQPTVAAEALPRGDGVGVGCEGKATPPPPRAAAPVALACAWDCVLHRLRRGAARCRGLTLPDSVRTTLRVYAYLLRNPSFVLPLFFGSFFLTMAEMVTWIFLFPYARRELQAPPQLFSLIMLVHLTSEVASFTGSSFLLQRKRIFVIFFTSAVCYSLKLYCYSIVRNPWWLLLIEVLHGPCAAFRLTAAVAHVTACAKRAERFFAKRPAQHQVQRQWGEAAPSAGAVQDSDAVVASENKSVDCYVAVVDSQMAAVHIGNGAPVSPASLSSASPPMSPTMATTLGNAPPQETIELLATAYSIMWFAATGLPMALTGLLPIILRAVLPPAHAAGPARKSTNGAGDSATTADPMELQLFRTVSLLLMVVACLFVVYNQLRMFH